MTINDYKAATETLNDFIFWSKMIRLKRKPNRLVNPMLITLLGFNILAALGSLGSQSTEEENSNQ